MLKMKRNLPEWAKAIIRKRKALGLSQAKAAERIGISLRTYQNWEQGRARPNQFTLLAIHAKLVK